MLSSRNSAHPRTWHQAQPFKPTGTRHHVVRPVRAALDPDAMANISNLAVGAGVGTFGLTFFALPKLYTKNTNWNTMLPALREANIRSVSVREAYRPRSAVLVDVRLPQDYEKISPAGSINIPLYLPIQKWDVPSIIRRIGFAVFGVYGTELNPDFIEQVQAAVPRGKDVMVICESGGSLEAKPGNDAGFQSRSLKALFYLDQAGVPKLSHVTGGLAQWKREGLPLNDDDDDEGELVLEQTPANAFSRVFARG